MRPSRTAKNKRREPGGERRAEIGPGLEQRARPPPHALRPPPTSGPFARAAPWHSRRPRGRASAFTGPSLPVRAAVIRTVSSPRSFVFASAPAASSSSTIAVVPVGAGQGKRRHAVVVRGFHVGLGVHEKLRHLEIVAIGRPVQGRHAVGLRLVHVDVLLEQRAQLPPDRTSRRRRQGASRRRGRSGRWLAERKPGPMHRSRFRAIAIASRSSDAFAVA